MDTLDTSSSSASHHVIRACSFGSPAPVLAHLHLMHLATILRGVPCLVFVHAMLHRFLNTSNAQSLKTWRQIRTAWMGWKSRKSSSSLLGPSSFAIPTTSSTATSSQRTYLFPRMASSNFVTLGLQGILRAQERVTQVRPPPPSVSCRIVERILRGCRGAHCCPFFVHCPRGVSQPAFFFFHLLRHFLFDEQTTSRRGGTERRNC